MYDGISSARFIPRFVQSRFASDSLYQSHRTFHWHRYSDIFSLSRSPKSLFSSTVVLQTRGRRLHV